MFIYTLLTVNMFRNCGHFKCIFHDFCKSGVHIATSLVPSPRRLRRTMHPKPENLSQQTLPLMMQYGGQPCRNGFWGWKVVQAISF